MVKRKLIGLTGPSRFSYECMHVIENFLEANFVLLYQENEENFKYWLDFCSAFIISGGDDIHPSLYGQNVCNQKNISRLDIQRDIRELQVINHALEKEKPMLGICRGHQLIAITLGLATSFVMDLSNCITTHHPQKSITYTRCDTMHTLEIVDDEFKIEESKEREVIYSILGTNKNEKKIWVNSFHHQGIVYVGNKNNYYKERDIIVIGIASAETDKKRDIIEIMRGKNWLSTQFHPEYDHDVNTPSRTILEMFKGMLISC